MGCSPEASQVWGAPSTPPPTSPVRICVFLSCADAKASLLTGAAACQAKPARRVGERTKSMMKNALAQGAIITGAEPTTWTIIQNDDPNHLGMRCNGFHEHQMALITSGCVPSRRPA